MGKVTEINIIGEGLQLKKLIDEANYSYGKLAKEYGIGRASLEAYLKYKQVNIVSFIKQMEDLFQKPYNQIVTPVADQIKEYILAIKRTIKEYNSTAEYQMMMEHYELATKYCQLHDQLMAKGNVALYKYNIGFTTESIEEMEEVVADSEKAGFKELMVYYSIQLAFLYLSTDKKQSRLALHRAEEVIKNESSTEVFSRLTLYNYYHFYGFTLNQLGKHEEAREKFEKAVEYAEDDAKIAKAYSNIAVSYQKLGVFKDTREWYNKALDKAQPFPDIKAGILNNMADFYLEKGKLASAITFIQGAMKMLSSEVDPARRIAIYDTYLDIYGKYDEVILQNILRFLDECVVFNENEQYLVTCLEKSLAHLIENENYESIQELIRRLLKYTRLEGEKRSLNDLSGVAMQGIHYLEDEDRFDIDGAFKEKQDVDDPHKLM